ncbi:MAG: putative toxin, partial [Fimbriimonadales bacterium]
MLDGLGHVRALLNPQGVPTDLYHYDSWGNPLPTGTETTRQPFRWNGAYGYEYIPATGLYHVGAREYDPRTARWLQRDPIDAASGDPNLYRYCLNDPVNLVDPSGLDFWEDLKRWYMGGMGGLSQWVDQNLMFGLTERFGTTAGRYDCGQASGWQLAWDATLWGGALLLAGFSSAVPGDEVVLGGAATTRAAASQGLRGTVRRGSAASAQRARQLGRAGEQKAGITGKKERITGPVSKKNRFPDQIDKNSNILKEVKNVRELRFTTQLQDYLKWCENNNYTFILITRRNTVLDKRLQDLPDLEILEDRLCLWDDAEAGAVFESGMAAIATTVLAYLRPGDLLFYSEP